MKTNRSSATKAVLLPVIAFILCFVICFSVTYTVAHAATEGSNVTFTDVPSTHWAYNDITEAASLGFINGYDDGRFGPNDSLTREQWAALIVRTLGSNVETGDHQPQGKHSFTTANASAWAIPELVKAENGPILTNTFNQMNNKEATANNNGWAPSLSNGYTFLNYKKAITRHEAAAMLGGAFTWTSTWHTYDKDFTPNANARATQFTDVPTGYQGHTFEIYVCIGVCANAGIINGYPDGSFGLNNNLTRAEAAAMLMRWYRMMPKDLDVIKTAGSVTWKTNQYTTFAVLTSPYTTSTSYTSVDKFTKNSYGDYAIVFSARYYTTKSMRSFIQWLMCYKNYNSFPDTAIQAKVDLGILEWNNPADHSQGWHGKYGIELYNAVTSRDDAALAELIARVENDHAVNLALYDRAIAAGQVYD